MPITTVDLTLANQWDALVAEIEAEVGPSKRLDGIQYVGKAYTLWTKKSPAIGVQLRDFNLGPVANMQRKLISIFNIVMGMQSTDESAAASMGENTPANGEDAMNRLRQLVIPGDGNGLLAVLNDGANYTLAGSAYKAIVSSGGFDWEIGPGAGAQIWAYAAITVTAEALVTILTVS